MPAWPVRIFSQSTPFRCWEACARIMWHYQHHGDDSGYAAAARGYVTLDRGLTPVEMNNFYRGLIGLESVHNPTGAFLRQRLGTGPAIFFTVNGVVGHAMVAAGYDRSHYYVANPYQSGEMTFDDRGNLGAFSAQGRLVSRPRSQIDAQLGEYIWYWA